jgi:YVTN family beta-propeller protein
MKSSNNSRWLLTLAFALVLLSIGIITHNAFADQVITTISLGDQHPSEIGVNPSSDKIYVTNIGSNTVSVIDGSTNNVLSAIPVGSGPWGVGINPNTNRIYIANTHNNTVSIIDGNTDSVVSTISLDSVSEIGVNPNTDKIYVSGGSGVLYVINGTTNTIMDTIPVSSTAYGVGVNPSTDKIYVGNYRDGTVSVIDGNTDSVVATVPVGNEPEDIGVNPNTNQIYVPNYFSDSVSVIDGSTNSVISTIPVASGPSGVAVNPVTDKIYVSHYTNSVSVIDGTTNSVMTIIRVGDIPQGVAANPNTNRIYVANHGTGCTGSQPGCTETPEPGTVSVIDGSSSNTSTAPSVPQNLQSTSGNSQVTLSWSAPSNNGGSPITNYKIYKSTSSGTETLSATIGNITSYNDGTVTNGQTYFYKVTAVNSIGESSQSNEASATPTMPITSPQPPTGLTATSASTSQINLSWITPTNNGGSAIIGYMIERSTDNGSSWSTVQSNTGSTATTYNDTGLASSTTYTYRVSAVNSVGSSQPSNTASATTNAVTQPPPVGITLNNVQSTSGTVSASNQMTLANFNAGTGNNRLLVVGISANNNNAISVTFGGVSMTQAAGSFYNNDVEFWYLKNPTGTGNVVVTTGGPTQAVVGAYSFAGVNQTTPIPTHVTKHNTTPNSPNITITTKFANDWVLDLPSIYGGSILGSPTCAQQWDVNVSDAITGASSSKMVPTPGAVTCKWTASSGDFWDDAAIEIKAAK